MVLTDSCRVLAALGLMVMVALALLILRERGYTGVTGSARAVEARASNRARTRERTRESRWFMEILLLGINTLSHSAYEGGR